MIIREILKIEELIIIKFKLARSPLNPSTKLAPYNK